VPRAALARASHQGPGRAVHSGDGGPDEDVRQRGEQQVDRAGVTGFGAVLGFFGISPVAARPTEPEVRAVREPAEVEG
jgi:hypothetical protein